MSEKTVRFNLFRWWSSTITAIVVRRHSSFEKARLDRQDAKVNYVGIAKDIHLLMTTWSNTNPLSIEEFVVYTTEWMLGSTTTAKAIRPELAKRATTKSTISRAKRTTGAAAPPTPRSSHLHPPCPQ